MNFIPRTTAPSKTNKFYYSNLNTYYKHNCGMPNCTAYTYGRGLEITNGEAKLPPSANAKNWYSLAKNYKKDNIPSVGSVICFSGGKSGYGHVAMVEFVNGDKSIRTSNSAKNGTNFYMQTLKPPYNYGKCVFQGFIHLFNDEPTPTPPEPTPTPPEPTHIYYVVKKGDNLSKIAKKYNTTWKNIYNKNKSLIDSQAKKHGVKSAFYNHIYIGQKLLIK